MLYSHKSNKPRFNGTGIFIAPSADVIGKVNIAQDCGVWYGAVLRGDLEYIEIGAGTNIQDGSVLHTDFGKPIIVGAGVTVGHKVILHGCTVGDNSLIGMGATVLSGARIGKNCIIGAHTLVPEDEDIPDNSLFVGVPGRIKREITANVADMIRDNGLYYVEHARNGERDYLPLND